MQNGQPHKTGSTLLQYIILSDTACVYWLFQAASPEHDDDRYADYTQQAEEGQMAVHLSTTRQDEYEEDGPFAPSSSPTENTTPRNLHHEEALRRYVCDESHWREP